MRLETCGAGGSMGSTLRVALLKRSRTFGLRVVLRLYLTGRGGSRGLAAAGSGLRSTIASPLQSIRLEGRKPANAACHLGSDATGFRLAAIFSSGAESPLWACHTAARNPEVQSRRCAQALRSSRVGSSIDNSRSKFLAFSWAAVRTISRTKSQAALRRTARTGR